MLILGISSASNVLGVALLESGKLLSEYSSLEGLRAEELAGHIDLILGSAKKKLEDVTAIAVTAGPGSYGGLRGGLATAKAISQSRNILLIGVSTMDAIAQNFEGIDGLYLIALHACKDEYNAALFSSADGSVRRLTDDAVVLRDDIAGKLAMVKGKMTFVCPVPDIYSRIRELNPGTEIAHVAGGQALPRASVVALMGGIAIAAGERADPLTMVPRYSHEPKIREFKNSFKKPK